MRQNPISGSWITEPTELVIANTYNEKRIGQFDETDMKALVNVMAQWRVLLGIDVGDAKQELIYICQFLYDHFKRFSMQDIILARDWAVSGKLDMSFTSSRNLNAAYVSKALNLYEEEKRIIVNRIHEKKISYIREKERNTKLVLTLEEKANQMKELIVRAYRTHKEGGLFYDIGDFIYLYLKKTRRLSTNKSDINDALNYAIEKLRVYKEEQSLVNKLTKTIESKQKNMKDKFAREYMILLYFDKHELKDIVESIKVSDFK